MRRTNTLIIGAGQAGLALSRCLTERAMDHVVLERGRIGQRWTERWGSLRLLTPNWMSRLPGFRYDGEEPEGFMTRDEVREYLGAYARSFDAPVEEQTTVRRVERSGNDWHVHTDRGRWLARNVVIATGHCQSTDVPAMARELPAAIIQVTTSGYRSPSQFPSGGVLVVGASASGVQLANELVESGHEVVLAVGRHTRLPRRYRGRDILYWLDRTGSLARPLSDVSNQEEAKREPSLQLIGSAHGSDLDLAVLAAKGVRLTGRLTGIAGTRVAFAPDLAATTAEADAQLHRVFDRIDRHVRAHGLEARHPRSTPPPPVPVDGAPLELDLAAAGIRSVLWATGYKRSYPWLHAPVLDAHGEILHRRGRTAAAGLFVLGLQFLIRRNSSFLDGVGRDAEEIADEIVRRTRWIAREAA